MSDCECKPDRAQPSSIGKKIRTQFEGEVDVSDLSFKRIAGSRIKHRVKQNWLKMYDKAGSVLRLEMVINDPEGFTVRKEVTRKGKIGRASCRERV